VECFRPLHDQDGFLFLKHARYRLAGETRSTQAISFTVSAFFSSMPNFGTAMNQKRNGCHQTE